MTGISKITDHIKAEAASAVKAVLNEGAEKCAATRAEQDKRAQDEYTALIRSGEKETVQRVERLARTAKLESRKSILSMKQDTVEAAFKLALDKIVGLPEDEYVAFLARQAGLAAQTGQEEIILNEGDSAKVGKKVLEAANAQLKTRGLKAELTLSGKTRPIAGGLILKQGDIEVNCAIETLLELKRGELAAQVAKVLFPA